MERRNNMKRSIALFTVLFAIAIFAMPTFAGPPGPPDPYVMPVQVANIEPISIFRQFADFDGANVLMYTVPEDKYLVIETVSVKATLGSTDSLLGCQIITSGASAPPDRPYPDMMLLTLPLQPFDANPINWTTYGTTVNTRAVVMGGYDVIFVLSINMMANISNGVDFSISGYLVDEKYLK